MTNDPIQEWRAALRESEEGTRPDLLLYDEQEAELWEEKPVAMPNWDWLRITLLVVGGLAFYVTVAWWALG